MADDINRLAERIKRVDKDAKLGLIYEMMIDFNISSGDIVEYCSSRGSVTLTTSQRLREINQTRKSARKRMQQRKESMEKARATKAENREKLIANAAAVAPSPKPKLSIQSLALESLGD